MRKAGLAYLTVIATVAAMPATGHSAGQVDMVCPIGGQAFSYTPPLASPLIGERPDGKPIGGGARFDIPVCPGNRLVLFQEAFSAQDKLALEKLIVDPEYLALPDGMTSYRAAWLMRRLDRDPQEVAAMLLQASWQADREPMFKRRYQAEYAALLEPLVRGKDDDLSMALAGRVANAHRELGQFEAAGSLLDALPMASLTAIIPAEERDGDVVTNAAAIEAARARRRLYRYLTGLKDLIAQRNSQSEPVAMLPEVVKVERCRESATLSDDDRAACVTLRAAGETPAARVPSP